MVTITELITTLQALDVDLSIDPTGALITDAPRDVITPDLAEAIPAHRDLLLWAVVGRRRCQTSATRTVRHVWADCTTCGQPCMVATIPADGPRCRMTPACEGRHTPKVST